MYWIDGNNKLHLRRTLHTNEKMYEKTSTEHLWLIQAIPKPNLVTFSSINATITNKIREKCIFLLRPSDKTLFNNKLTTILWIPYKSITISQRDVYKSLIPASTQYKDNAVSNNNEFNDNISTSGPQLQLQIY